jgi:hypothetical protein
VSGFATLAAAANRTLAARQRTVAFPHKKIGGKRIASRRHRFGQQPQLLSAKTRLKVSIYC